MPSKMLILQRSMGTDSCFLKRVSSNSKRLSQSLRKTGVVEIILVHPVKGGAVLFTEVFGNDDVVHNEQVIVVFIDKDLIHGDPLDVFELEAAAGRFRDSIRIAIAGDNIAE